MSKRKHFERRALTKDGKQVDLTLTWPVEDGTMGWAVNAEGYAVKVFIPCSPFENFCRSMKEHREPAYSEAEMESCWNELSDAERAEWE